MTTQVYDSDLLRWSEEQAALLRAGRFAELDFEHILEELEEMGKEQKMALQSLFRQLLIHLLKLDLSPAQTPRAKWVDEVVEFRAQAQTRLDETPSLKHHAEALFAAGASRCPFHAYGEAVTVPERCP